MDPIQLQNWPFDVNATCFRLNLADVDDGIALAVGGYFVHLVSTEPLGCTLRLGAVAVAPADDDAAGAAGAILAPGVPMTLTVRTAASLHGIMNAGSAVGTLFLTKVR